MKKIILLIVFALGLTSSAQINQNVSPYTICNPSISLSATFDLTTKIPEILGTQNPADYTITFHAYSLSGPVIQSPTSFIGIDNTTIFVKQNNNATQEIYQSSFVLRAPSSPQRPPLSVEECNMFNTGIAEFSLGEIESTLMSQTISLSYFNTSFYISEADANNSVNELTEYFYTNTVAFQQTIYARVQVTGTSCYTITPVTLNVSSCVTANEPGDMTSCIDPASSTACFDLSSNNAFVLDGQDASLFSVTYFSTQVNAYNNTLPLASIYCTAQEEIIYARVTHNLSSEFDVVMFNVIPTTLLADIVQPVTILTENDQNNDLSVTFNLNEYTVPGIIYYATEADAVDGVNPITNPAAYTVGISNPQVNVFIRVPAGNCYKIQRLQLVISDYNNAYLCSEARSLCGALGNPFSNTYGGIEAVDGDYNCLGSQPNPSWFYLPVGQGGNLQYIIEQNDLNGNGIDVDFICYGPFNTLSEGCVGYTNANVVACSYSTAPVETVHIPNAVAGQYYLLMVTNFSDDPGVITINETSVSQGTLTCSGLIMNAFLDSKSNGIKDAGENGFNLGSFTYEANNNGTVHTITDPDGTYGLYDEVLTNTYDINFAVASQYSAYYNVTTSSYNDVLVQPGSAIVTYYFPVTVTQVYQDLSVHVIGNSVPRPGFSYENTIVYTNSGNLPVASGTVSFTKDPMVTISNISQSGTIATANGFDYTFTNLQPFETRTITVTMNVPTIPQIALGQLLESTASIVPVTGDITPSNNTSSSIQEIVGSYDPNDKMESRGERILISEFGNNDYLYYTIRFQNTGTAAAEIVRIQDILDNQLDESTVEMIRASHNYSLDRVNNTLTWTFNNINLPHSGANEPASHGYVYFRVKPVAGFQVGDVIPNTASIYFDFNPAIVTNTVNSEFVAAMGIEDITASAFTMYPNPADKAVNLQLGNMADSIKSVRVYDVTGKTLYFNTNLSAANTSIDVTQFGTGAYFVELVTGSNIKAVKKLLVK